MGRLGARKEAGGLDGAVLLGLAERVVLGTSVRLSGQVLLLTKDSDPAADSLGGVL